MLRVLVNLASFIVAAVVLGLNDIFVVNWEYWAVLACLTAIQVSNYIAGCRRGVERYDWKS